MKIIKPPKISTYQTVGTRAIREVKKIGMQSSTRYHLDHFPIDREVPKNINEYWNLSKKIFKQRAIVRKFISKSNDQNKRWQFIILNADLAKKNKLGNCGEQSAIILTDTYERQPTVRKATSIGVIITDQHGKNKPGLCNDQFVVYGMKRSANVDDPSTWGKHALMVNAWADLCLPVKEGLTKLKELFKFDETKHKIKFVKIAQFDKVKHNEKGIYLE